MCKRLKEIREYQGISREELADDLCVEVSDIVDWEEYNMVPLEYLLSSMSIYLSMDEDELKSEIEYEDPFPTVSNDDGGGSILGLLALAGGALLLSKLFSKKEK